MSSYSYRKSLSSRETRTAGGLTKTEEKSVTESRTEKGGKVKEEKSVRFKKDGLTVSEQKDSREHTTPGTGRRSLRAINDGNNNEIEVKVEDKKGVDKKGVEKKVEAKKETKGAVAAESKSEAAKRRQKTSQSIEQRMLERKQQKVADQKKRVQGRAAFKEQLESNAIKRNGPTKSSFKRSADSNIDKLLKWAQKRTDMYPGVEITDFSSSWADGLAFCALLHSFFPEEFPLDKMDENDRKVNLDLAFSFAEEKEIPQLLDTVDMMRSKNPEPRSIITYVHTIYKVLVQDKAEKEKAEKEAKEKAKSKK